MNRLGNILIATSSIFFVESAFEMYVLTPVHGRQMLFFSLAHGSLSLFLVVALSGVAFVTLAVFAFVAVLSCLTRRPGSGGSYPRMMLVVLPAQLVHTTLLLTYETRAAALFP